MKKKVIAVILAFALVAVCIGSFSLPAHASDDIQPCLATIYGNLKFEGNTARCSASVVDVDSQIILTMVLWHGSEWVHSWSAMGVTTASLEERWPIQSGETYTLRVQSIVDGVQQKTVDVVRTAP